MMFIFLFVSVFTSRPVSLVAYRRIYILCFMVCSKRPSTWLPEM